jgi:hypothetical protein
MKQSSKVGSTANKAMANIMARAKSTNKSIAAAIGGRRTRKRNSKTIPKSIALRAIKANRRVASAAAAAIGGKRM